MNVKKKSEKDLGKLVPHNLFVAVCKAHYSACAAVMVYKFEELSSLRMWLLTAALTVSLLSGWSVVRYRDIRLWVEAHTGGAFAAFGLLCIALPLIIISQAEWTAWLLAPACGAIAVTLIWRKRWQQ